jgi:hypothetical protein
MTGTLSPTLTALDWRILAVLTPGIALRAARVAQLVHGSALWRCDHCANVFHPSRHPRDLAHWHPEPFRCYCPVNGTGEPPCDGMYRPVLATTPEQRREVREILRGLELIGAATTRKGWWRAA